MAPLKDYWITVKDSTSRDLTFPDGKKMMNYKKGELVKLGGSVKLMELDGIFYKVRMGRSVHRSNGKLSGYVEVNDVIGWPGSPSYS